MGDDATSLLVSEALRARALLHFFSRECVLEGVLRAGVLLQDSGVLDRRHDALALLGKSASVLALLSSIATAILAALRPRASLVAENLVLRQQLAVLCRAGPRPRLRAVDRAFWVVLSRV